MYIIESFFQQTGEVFAKNIFAVGTEEKLSDRLSKDLYFC